jgi:hypothetical protein
MNTLLTRAFCISAIFAMIGSTLHGQTADQQLKAEAVQKRTDGGIELNLVLTNVSSKPMKVVAGNLQTTFPGRGGQLAVIFQEPLLKEEEKADLVSLLPGESKEIRLHVKKDQLPKDDTLIANVTYRISEEFGRRFGVWHGSIFAVPKAASESPM